MLTRHQALTQRLMQEEDYECKSIVVDRAERIVQELAKTARMLSRRGYGTTNLIFSDCSFVSLTYGGAISEVAALVRGGSQPLGFIAPHRDRQRSPFAESWDSGDNTALAELRRIANWVYGHRFNARETQQ